MTKGQEGSKTVAEQRGKDVKRTSKPETSTTETVTTTEEEIIDSFSKPIAYIENEVNKGHEKTQDTFRILLDENAKLANEKKKLEAKLADSKSRSEVLKVDLENERDKLKQKDAKIAEMEGEIKTLILSRKNKEMKKDAAVVKDKYAPPSEDSASFNPDEPDARMRELQSRLKRIAAESADKDQRIIDVQKELSLTQEFAQELHTLVDEQRAADIKEKIEEEKLKSKKVSYYDPANVISTGHVQKSEVCVLQ